MKLKYVKAAWYTFGGLFLAVLLLGFIQNPALQSIVSLVFFAFGFPLLIIAIVFSVVYWRQRKGSSNR
jgi:uncharacterized membrane protein